MEFPENDKRGYTKFTVLIVLAVIVFGASVWFITSSKSSSSDLQGQVDEIAPPVEIEKTADEVLKGAPIDKGPGKPDFIITDLDYKFNKRPRENFPYFEYVADIKIKNTGDSKYEGDDLFISAGNDQNIKKILNNDDSLDLEVGVSEMIRDYQLLLDKNVEGKSVVTFTIDPENLIAETDEENNTYSITIFNEINSIEVKDVSLSRGEILLSWEPPASYKDLNYQIRYIVEDSEFLTEDNVYKADFDYQNSFASDVKWYLVSSSPYLMGASASWSLADTDIKKKNGKYSTYVPIPADSTGKLLLIIEDKKYAMKSDAVFVEY